MPVVILAYGRGYLVVATSKQGLGYTLVGSTSNLLQTLEHLLIPRAVRHGDRSARRIRCLENNCSVFHATAALLSSRTPDEPSTCYAYVI